MRKLVLMCLLLVSALAFSDIIVKEGVGTGAGGEVKVAVEVDGDKIISIKVLESADTTIAENPAVEELIKAIIEKQSVDAETALSEAPELVAFKEAVKNALSKEQASNEEAPKEEALNEEAPKEEASN